MFTLPQVYPSIQCLNCCMCVLTESRIWLISGPSILDLFNSLIKHLKGSVEYKSTSDDERQANSRFQESIINTIGM